MNGSLNSKSRLLLKTHAASIKIGKPESSRRSITNKKLEKWHFHIFKQKVQLNFCKFPFIEKLPTTLKIEAVARKIKKKHRYMERQLG